MIGETIGNLKIISELGKGGMGVVYLAEHVSLKKKFAIKCLSLALTNDPQFRKRFYEEARNQALLGHPNIVQATDFFEFKDQFFFVMEYVDGQDLAAMIRAKGPLPEKEALAIFKDVLEALHYAHNKNLIHRDVKPPNILIDESGRARLMDFGIAIMCGRERLTATGTAVGSPWYMSPEQITSPLDLDKRSDVYAAGIVLYEMLTGDVPFDGETDFAVKDQQVHTQPQDPHQRNPKIDAELSSIILKALDKNPDNRYQGCNEFLQSIKKYQSKKTILPESPFKKLLWLFVVIAIVSVGISIYVIMNKNRVVVVQKIQDPTVQYEKARIWINSGMDKAAFVCRESHNVALKRENMRLAIDSGATDMAHKYEQRIVELKRNIEDAATEYSDFIKKLGGLENPVVEEEFRKLVKLAKSQKAQVNSDRLKIIHGHYNNYLQRNMPSGATIVRQLCE
ncbi:MAG: serine/threonine protein kinase [Desulfobulbaceae bacterium]|nr:serine/threonine protein kinase [Desulfobulbaceae bacterium]